MRTTPHMSGSGISRKISDRFPADLPRVGMENGLLDTWCCRVVSLDVRPTRGLALRSLFALWPRGISFEPGRRWALELHSRALWYLPPGWLGSWWHEKRRIDASPARAALIRSMPPKVQTTSPKNGKNGLLWVRWSAIWANPETRQTRPPTTATFPRRTADKSPPQQHDLSILRLIEHVVLLGSYLARLGMPFSSARGPTIPSLGCLILTWTRYSESGQPRPRTEQRVNVRNRRPTCETAGSHAGRVGTQVAVAHGQSMTDHGAPTHRARCSIHRN